MSSHRGVWPRRGGVSNDQRDATRVPSQARASSPPHFGWWVHATRAALGCAAPEWPESPRPRVLNESTSKLWPKVLCEHSITTNLESFCSSANNEMEGAAASLVYFVVNALLQPANKRADGDAGPMTSADDSAGAARSQRAAPACFFSDPFPTCQPFDSSQQRPGVGGRRQQPDSTIPRPGQGRPLPDIGSLPTCAACRRRRVLTPPDRPTHGRSIVMAVGVKLQYLRFRRVDVIEAMHLGQMTQPRTYSILSAYVRVTRESRGPKPPGE